MMKKKSFLRNKFYVNKFYNSPDNKLKREFMKIFMQELRREIDREMISTILNCAKYVDIHGDVNSDFVESISKVPSGKYFVSRNGGIGC